MQAAANEDYTVSLKRLVTNTNFLLLTVTYGLSYMYMYPIELHIHDITCIISCIPFDVAGVNTGSYYAIGTLLNPTVLHYFEGATTHAGRIGLTLVLTGIAGSIVAGLWLDRTKLFK